MTSFVLCVRCVCVCVGVMHSFVLWVLTAGFVITCPNCTLHSLMQYGTCDCVCLGTVGGEITCENLLLGSEITDGRNPNRLLV